MKDDYISRQAAMTLPVLPREYRTYPTHDLDDAYEAGWNEALYCIGDLPSAEPEPKKGKWMEHYSHEDGERDGVYCSNCEEWFYFGGQFMNYCPECGADMRGEQHE